MTDLLTDSEFDLFRKVIYDESGITFSETNRSILDSRLKDRLREKQLASVQEYYQLITSDKEEMKIMLDSVTTNLTRFFRNQPHFDALINYVVPHIVENKRKSGNSMLKIWSAGCSTGEEPYTIAMVLKEILPPGFSFSITASDLSLKSLSVGKQGFYPESRIAGVPDKYLEKYFTRSADGYQVNEDVMKTIHFDYHNLKHDSGARNFDIVFCRNVLIYFDEPAQQEVVNRFWDAMAPKSYLFIGHSESLFGMKTQFEFLKTDWACLYQKNA
ncbi:MAG: protein-glutamate O-methyltransferase CheR [Bacteroides sp.]|nr:protein-glutamate O-methyltransferase CheR [Prevotella sp.]MCM1408430.1 protein-glutamate O-methyltransferase CheR [Treponema brennaborense]MCM1469408.1 protein-glutamate O-methyltransferase CheR [Bacteroides sp.]